METNAIIPNSSFWQNDAWRAGPVPRLSIVFPTHRRPDTLALVLDALNTQTGLSSAEFEVVVCDDASGDNTPEVLRRASARAAHPLACLVLPQQGGPARARNAAMHVVRVPVVLLLGDDILPPPNLVERHARWHAAHPETADALLGCTIWDETLPPNALMHWLEQGGRQFAFNYRDLSSDRPVSANFFYTCHVSFKRQLFTQAGGFDESFPFASHEDLELGLRMEQQGMRLHFDPTLVARHRHWLDLSAVCRRVYRMGYSSVRFWRTVARPPSPPRALARGLVMRIFEPDWVRRGTLRLGGSVDLTYPRPLRWRLLLASQYWSGAADATRGREPAVPTIPSEGHR